MTHGSDSRVLSRTVDILPDLTAVLQVPRCFFLHSNLAS